MDDQQQAGNPLFKSRLGRGLNSLIGGGPSIEEPQIPTGEAGEFQQVDVEAISRNPYQPRKDFDAESLNELIESIVLHGVLQPILCRKTEAGLQLIAGERRWIAAKKAGLKTVPCRVVEMEERQVCEVAIIENLQRSDLNELEKGQAFQVYLEKFQCSTEELARKLGKDRSTVSNAIRLLELPEFVKLALQAGRITAGHARAMLPLESEAEQIALCQRIQSEHMNVRQVEEAVREKTQPADTDTIPIEQGGKPGKKGVKLSNHIKSLQEQLRDQLGCKVEIQMKSKDAGKLIVHFNSNDEFERIVGHLRKAS
jgi:ParB family chromosome partitioning protein